MDFSTVIEDPKVFTHSDFTYSVKKISQNDLTTEKETQKLKTKITIADQTKNSMVRLL